MGDVSDSADGLVQLGAAGVPQEITVALRTMCYAWPTTGHFHNLVLECRFWGMDGRDSQLHHLASDALWKWAGDRISMRARPEEDEVHSMLLRARRQEQYDVQRHGTAITARGLFDARLTDMYPATKRSQCFLVLGMQCVSDVQRFCRRKLCPSARRPNVQERIREIHAFGPRGRRIAKNKMPKALHR